MIIQPGDLITVDFPGVTGVKRRPAIILSSNTYHALRPDIIIGLITSQTKNLGATDYLLQDWSMAGLRVESVFRSFIVTLPKSTGMIKVGQVSDRDWSAILKCIRCSVADLEQP